MIIKPNGNSGQGVDLTTKPQIWFTGKWTGWYLEIYNGVPYWEALISESGTLTAAHSYTADAYGIGGGGAGGEYQTRYGSIGTGGGSGYTNMVEDVIIPSGGTAVTIGNGATSWTSYNANSSDAYKAGARGGTTSFLSLSCPGGYGGSSSERTTAGEGGSNGSSGNTTARGGANGTPGEGKIMSKFWSAEHNTEYGKGGYNTSINSDASDNNGGGGGGYLDVGGTNSTSGHGYGAGGGGSVLASSGYTVLHIADWHGKSGCLIIRIKAA